jgi:hypothetical protein
MASASDDYALSALLSSSPQALERAKDLLNQLRLSTGPGSANELDSFCTLALPAVAALLACKACVPVPPAPVEDTCDRRDRDH